MSGVRTKSVEATVGAFGTAGFVNVSSTSEGSSQADVGVKTEYVTPPVKGTTFTFSFKVGATVFKF